MLKKLSKKSRSEKSEAEKSASELKQAEKSAAKFLKPKKNRENHLKRIKTFFKTRKENRGEKIKLHKSFKRSYREDYAREIEVPGVMYHIFATFRAIFKNWKLFLPLLLLSMILAGILIGIMDEESYEQFQTVLDETAASQNVEDLGPVAKSALLLVSTVTTGGLSGGSSESAAVFAVIIFIIIWLTTIYLLRHVFAGHKVKFRDGLYNGMGPLISSLVVVLVAVVQCVPIMVLVVVFSAAQSTDLFATPFYALIFFIFAALMILLSGYLLSSTLMALVAVSAPGLYPADALRTASNLMAGRRIKFIIRIIALIIALVILWVIVMVPLILFDLFMKQFEWTAEIPFVSICLLTMTCFTGIYLTAYLYMYYRWMLNYEEN